jgi:hypothetical protein
MKTLSSTERLHNITSADDHDSQSGSRDHYSQREERKKALRTCGLPTGRRHPRRRSGAPYSTSSCISQRSSSHHCR